MKESDPPRDFTQMLRETFSELCNEAHVKPLDLNFPPEVVQSVKTYTKDHSLDPAKLVSLAMKAHIDRLDLMDELVSRLIQDPDSVDWPLEDPILCVAIAFMRRLTNRWADKMHEKFGLTHDEFDPADWWKG